MNCQKVTNHIVSWLTEYCNNAKMNGFVVGISGGIDSSVVSTLCAMTGKKTVVVSMPMVNDSEFFRKNDLSSIHASWLRNIYDNVEPSIVFLKNVFESFKDCIVNRQSSNKLAMANLQSRLRMCALYNFAADEKLLVVGTGNYVEDYGIGFFTKYGDGGVDISPIGQLTKTEVRELAKYLHIDRRIIAVAPTDGLWEDGRTDEDQIGATYEELEWAMQYRDDFKHRSVTDFNYHTSRYCDYRQREVLEIYNNFHTNNAHKMNMPPICRLSKEIK